MDPATLAIVSLASTAIGTVTSVVGGMQQASAQRDAANYQAAVAQNNAIIQQQNATRAAEAGRAQAQAQDMKNAARYGAIVAAEGASGVDLGSGSSEEVRKSARQLGRLDTLTVMDNALQQSRAYQTAASSELAQAQLDRMKASSAQSAGLTSGFGSILSGASSFADKWIRFQDTGALPGRNFPGSGFAGSGIGPGTGGLY